MKKILAIIIMALLLSGCAEPELADGYQLGDFTKMGGRELSNLIGAIDTYCNKVSDSSSRKMALQVIRLSYPLVPSNGICQGHVDANH